METKVLLGKLVLGLGGVLLSMAACLWVERATVSDRQFNAVAWTGLLVTRGGLFVLVFFVLGLPAQSDVAGYYYPQMKMAQAGGLPYRDFVSSYAPLFAYVGGAMLWLWDSPKAIVALTFGFEVVGFAAWRGVANQGFSERTARLATLLYVVNALPIFNAAVDGQNQTWAACFLGLAVLLLLRRHWARSGAVFGASLVAVKFLPLIFAPVLWLQAERRTRWLVGCSALPVLIYGVCLAKHLDILQPLRFEGQQLTSGCLPFLLGPLCPAKFPMVAFDVVLLGTLVMVFGAAFRHRPAHAPQRGVFLLTLLLLTLLILSKKAFTNYLLLGWFPICLCAVALSPRRTMVGAGLLGGFGTLALLEPSLWFRWFGQRDFATLLRENLRTESPVGSRVHVFIFLLCEATLIGAYVWYALGAWKLYREIKPVDEPNPTATLGAPLLS